MEVDTEVMELVFEAREELVRPEAVLALEAEAAPEDKPEVLAAGVEGGTGPPGEESTGALWSTEEEEELLLPLTAACRILLFSSLTILSLSSLHWRSLACRSFS